MADADRLVWFIAHPLARVWSVNPYRRCAIGCVYCIARSQGLAEPWFGAECVVDALRPRLAGVPHSTELFVGALTDAYPPEEERLGVTRRVLLEVSRQGRPFCIATKSNLVERDVDILTAHRGHCDVFVSLCSIDQKAVSRLEPNAPTVAERLAAVAALSRAGVDVNIDAAPWIPGVGDIEAILDALPDGVRVQVAPLDLRHLGSEPTIAGMALSQDGVNAAYRRHRETVGDRSGRIRWKGPVGAHAP